MEKNPLFFLMRYLILIGWTPIKTHILNRDLSPKNPSRKIVILNYYNF